MTYADDLIEAMREELQQYGEMLARLELRVLPRTRDAAEEARMGMITLEEQRAVLDTATRRRMEVQNRLARASGLTEDAGLPGIMPFLPPQYQLLVGALRDENQDLALRCKASLAKSESCYTVASERPNAGLLASSISQVSAQSYRYADIRGPNNFAGSGR
jgi:hypothetical protein